MTFQLELEKDPVEPRLTNITLRVRVGTPSATWIADNLRGALRTPGWLRLGELTRIAFAGGWRPAVEAYEQHADVERLPEVERLLTRAVRDAAKHNLGDAIDAARSALASCPGVPALAQDVARIIAILEAL